MKEHAAQARKLLGEKVDELAQTTSKLTEATKRAESAERTIQTLKESVLRRDERIKTESTQKTLAENATATAKRTTFLESINQEVRVYTDRVIAAYPALLTEHQDELYKCRTLMEAQRIVLGYRHGKNVVR